MREAQPELTANGAKILAVGTGVHFQAEQPMASEYDFECLVDPGRNLNRALGVELDRDGVVRHLHRGVTQLTA